MDNTFFKRNKKEIFYELGLVVTALLWGSTFPIGKIGLNYYSPLFLTMSKYLLGGIILGIILNKRIFTITKKQLFGGIICGSVFYFAYLIEVIGLQYTTPAKQSFLAALYVIMIPFLYWIIYKRKPDMYNFVAAILTIAGIWLLTVNGPSGFNKGDMITIFSSFLYAMHIVIIGYLIKQMNPIILTFLQTIVAGIIGLIVSLITEPLPTEFPIAGMLIIIYMTVFGTIIAYGLQIICQKYISEMKTSIILSLESVFGTLLSVILIDDPFTQIMFFGCLIIFLGILTSETKLKFLKLNKL